MPKIALMKVVGGGYYEDYSEIIKKVSEWEEVTTEELALMRDFYTDNGGYTIIEFVDNQRDKIDFAVKSQLEYIKQKELRKQKEKEKKAEQALARKYKLNEKKLEDKKKLLEQLKQELGE